MFFELKITNILKSSGWGLEKSCHGNRIFKAVGVLPIELLAYKVSMVSVLQIGQDLALFIYLIQYWPDVISHLICIL